VTRVLWFCLAIALPAACSSRDQSLGETRSADPDPHSTADPDPKLEPEPDPPEPEPKPEPTPYPCEVSQRSTFCLPLTETCRGRIITSIGFECGPDQQCCEATVGCPQTGCGGSNGGPVLAPGGASNAGAGGAE
jgi:hypothetical protein